MVKHDAVGGEQPVALPVVPHHPVRVHLRDRVGAPRAKRRLLVLGRWGVPEHFAARGLVEAAAHAALADGLQEPNGAERGDVAGIVGHVEAHAHMALCPQVIDLFWADLIEEVRQLARVGKVAVVQVQARLRLVGVPVQVIDSRGVERARPPDKPVDRVAFGQQKLGQVGAVLAGNSGDQRNLRQSASFLDQARTTTRPGAMTSQSKQFKVKKNI